MIGILYGMLLDTKHKMRRCSFIAVISIILIREKGAKYQSLQS